MAKEQFFKVSDVTGKKYDVFDTVRILNVKQAAFYSASGLELLHVEVSKDRKTEDPVYVFYFSRSETKPIYDLWCRRRDDSEKVTNDNHSLL